jgi:hypothetical protein
MRRCSWAMLVVVAWVIWLVAPASGAVHTASFSFSPPADQPDIGQTPVPSDAVQEYDQSIAVTYDDVAGTVVVKFAEFQPGFWGATLTTREIFLAPACDVTTSGVLSIITQNNDPEQFAGVFSTGPYANPYGTDFASLTPPHATATVPDADGAGATATFDGTTFRFSFSAPSFVGRDWRCATIRYPTEAPVQLLSGYPRPHTIAAPKSVTAQIARKLHDSPTCLSVRLAPTDHAYARVEFLSRRCPGDGDAVFHHINGVWHNLHLRPGQVTCPVRTVSEQVQTDLAICPV